MRALLRFSLVVSMFLLSVSADPLDVPAASNCPDSTEVLEPIFGWDIPAAGFDIVVGTNRLVYVTDPVNQRICRYTLYGDEEMCWESADPPDPGSFFEPRWLSWNPVNDRLYVCGQLNTPARVPVFSAAGTFLFEIASDTLSTQPGKFAGDVGPIAIDPVTGLVWIYENNVLNSVLVRRIQEFDLNGEFTGRVFNIPVDCLIQGSGRQVEDMTVDSTGTVYLLERATSGGVAVGEVHRINPDVGCVLDWGNAGGPGQLRLSVGIAIDKDGHINVLDFNSSGKFVRKYNRGGDHILSQQVGLPSEPFWFALEFIRDVADPFMFVARDSPDRVLVFGTGVEPRNILETTWVDATSFQLKTDDLELLAQCQSNASDKRKEMTGVVADGVSPLLLRLHLPESGTVRWKLADPDNPGVTEELGTLANLDSTETGVIVDTPVETVDNEYIAFAVYIAPIDFERPSVPGDGAVGERPLEVTAEFMPDSSPDSVAIVRNLTIERPTVLFLHGFLEEPEDWRNFKSIKSAADAPRWGNGRFFVANYTASNGSPLLTNARKLQNALTSINSSARARGVASAQVDIISHSMGGLVLRRLADATPQDPFKYRNTTNMGQGYYHKALFLNVPHQGSPLADITVTIRDIMNGVLQAPGRRLAALGILRAYAAMAGADFNQLIGGAIDDMSLGSDAVTNLQEFLAPTHGHVGTGGSDLWFTPRLLQAAGTRAVVAYIGLATSLTNLPELLLLDTEVHDIAVLLDSQVGGLSSPGHYITANFEDGLHESSFLSSISGSRAQDWATRSVGDASFFASSLPGGSSLAPSPETQQWVHNLTQAIEDEMPEFAGVTVRITTPSPGFIKSSGDSFLVEVEPFSNVSTVVVTYPGGALFMDSTLTGYAHTDSAFNGPFELSALALMADGTMGRSESVTITVRPPGSVTLNSIEVTPPSVSLPGVGSLRDLRVVGNYSDGVERDISSGASGTTYTGFDAGVISVSAEGVVRGSGAGITTVTVQKAAFSQGVSVEVGGAPPINNRPHALAGGPYQICNGDGVTLDASNSFDFDDGQLTYTWDLNGDGQFDDLTGATVFYSPPYIVDERLVGLRVTDSSGATSEDYTAIQVPLSCFASQRICVSAVVAIEASDLGADGAGDIYILQNFGTSGNIRKRGGTCTLGEGSTAIFDPEDLDELAVDSTGVAYVIGAPSDERILLFGPGTFGELEPLIPVFTTPYSLVTGIAVDRRGNLYGSDYDAGAQHVFIRKFDQAFPEANLLASWNLTTSAGITSAEPLSVAIGPDSAIFVGIGNEVLKGVAQGGGYALERRWGTFGLDAGQFRGVSDVAVGPDGDVFVADYGNHRIQRFTDDGTFRSMRKGTHVSNGRFYHPTAVIAIDSDRVAVADFEFGGDPRVQVFYWGDAVPTTVQPWHKDFHDALVQNYPNPFNPTTTIAFSLGENSHVVLAIYDVRGAIVRTLINEPRVAGEFRVEWDGENDSGASVSSGVYFYRLTAGRFHSTKKMVLLK